MKRGWPLLLLLSLGCTPKDYSDWMPLAQGNEWAYEVNLHLKTGVAEVKVVGPTSVGPVEGWLLRSEYGVSRMGWSGEELLASELAGVRFFPPLPTLRPAREKQKWTWTGKVLHAGQLIPATASVTQEPDEQTVDGRERDCLKVTAELRIEGQPEMTLRTWTSRHLGIVRQDLTQPGRDPVPSLLYISGPT